MKMLIAASYSIPNKLQTTYITIKQMIHKCCYINMIKLLVSTARFMKITENTEIEIKYSRWIDIYSRIM